VQHAAFHVCALSAVLVIGLQSMAVANDFTPGQVWSYQDANPATSRVIIGKVDKLGNGQNIVSISVTDAPIPTTEAPLQTIGHMPFDEEVLQTSLIKQEGNGTIPAQFADGYETWRAAYDAGKAGAFTIPVVKAVQYIKQVVESPSTPSPH
jgi:hypothetical protein